jgi:hypothetical protein
MTKYIIFSFFIVFTTYHIKAQCTGRSTDNVPGKQFTLVWADEFGMDGAVCSENWHHQTQLPLGGSSYNGEI